MKHRVWFYQFQRRKYEVMKKVFKAWWIDRHNTGLFDGYQFISEMRRCKAEIAEQKHQLSKERYSNYYLDNGHNIIGGGLPN